MRGPWQNSQILFKICDYFSSLVNRTKNGIEFKDDYLEYSLYVDEDGEASIQAAGYVTW